MFEQLFRHPAALKRHREGPLADERASYLRSLASRERLRDAPPTRGLLPGRRPDGRGEPT